MCVSAAILSWIPTASKHSRIDRNAFRRGQGGVGVYGAWNIGPSPSLRVFGPGFGLDTPGGHGLVEIPLNVFFRLC